MKRKLSVLLAVSLLVAIIGCATTSTTLTPAQQYDLDAYKILAGAKASYDTAFKALADLQKQGKLSDADAKKAVDAGNLFYLAYLTAESAYEIYHASQTDPNQQSLAKQLQDLSVRLGVLLAAIPVKQ